MQTCIKCMKFTEPEVIVIERSPRYPLCDKCGVSLVDLIERMPLDPPEDEAGDPPEDTGEINEVKEKASKKKKSKKK